jgi:hypothetical protein
MKDKITVELTVDELIALKHATRFFCETETEKAHKMSVELFYSFNSVKAKVEELYERLTINNQPQVFWKSDVDQPQ